MALNTTESGIVIDGSRILQKAVSTMPERQSPPATVLLAFGLIGIPVPLAGGQGESFVLGSVVLKPTRDPKETGFLCQVQKKLVELRNEAYRVAEPLSVLGSEPPEYVVQNWTATKLIAGAGDPTIRVEELLPASRAMHEDLRQLIKSEPVCISQRVDRWAWAARASWGEPLENIPNVDAELLDHIKPWLLRLKACCKELDADSIHHQLIHGDLTENIMFADQADLPPGIIDFSAYWYPVEYAEAVVLADGLTWLSWGEDKLDLVGRTNFRLQMLIRALLFRLTTFCIEPDRAFIDANLPKLDLEGSVSLVERIWDEFAN